MRDSTFPSLLALTLVGCAPMTSTSGVSEAPAPISAEEPASDVDLLDRGELVIHMTDGFDENYGEVLASMNDGFDFARQRLDGHHGKVSVLILGPHEESARRLVRDVFCANKFSSRRGLDRESQVERIMAGDHGGTRLLEQAKEQQGDYFLSADLDADDPVCQLVFVSPQTHDLDNPRSIGQIAMHEYIHVYQMSFRPAGATGDDDPGPDWLSEGLADYLSWYWASQQGWMRSRSGLQDLHAEMDRRMDGVQQLLAGESATAFEESERRTRDEIRAELGYRGEAMLLYWAGSWAVAWLVDRAGLEVVISDLYRDTALLGWEAAFERNFKMSVEDFHQQFREFVANKPRGEQLSILPSEDARTRR